MLVKTNFQKTVHNKFIRKLQYIISEKAYLATYSSEVQVEWSALGMNFRFIGVSRVTLKIKYEKLHKESTTYELN